MCASSRWIGIPFALLVCAASNAPRADEPAASPKPTCTDRCPATVVSPNLKSISAPLLAAADALAQQRIKECLSNWEAASRDVVPPTVEDEHVAYVVHKSKSSGHEIAVLLEFQNPVRAETLAHKYRWTRVAETGDDIRLTAEPTEEVEKLFYGGFEVELNSETSLPVAVRFIDRNGKPKDDSLKLAVKTRPAIDNDEVQLTSAEVTRSPGPFHFARKATADSKNELPATQSEPTEISPKLEAVLKNWEAAAAKQRTVDVKFERRIYDTTFKTESRARGRIYLERPDKGRLEVIGVNSRSMKSERKDSMTGKPFELTSDASETWILTEEHLLQIAPAEKFVEKIELTDTVRGLCNGSLSMLGVGPVEFLRTNFHLTLTKRDAGAIWISAKPNARMEASAKEVKLILDESTWLPRFSKYIDPAGNLETLYQFSQWKVNEPLEPSDKPLEPDLSGYKIHRLEIAKNKPPACPSLIGLTAKDAADVLKKCNYDVHWQRGEPAKNDKLVHVVYEQTPDPKTPLPNGEKVILKVYDKIPPTVQKN